MKNESENNNDEIQNNDIVESEVLILEDENGNQNEFYLIATIPYEDNWYICLEPAEPIEGFEEGELLILEVQEDKDGNDIFVTIGDEKSFKTFLMNFLNFKLKAIILKATISNFIKK